jgi:hypothetical protein
VGIAHLVPGAAGAGILCGKGNGEQEHNHWQQGVAIIALLSSPGLGSPIHLAELHHVSLVFCLCSCMLCGMFSANHTHSDMRCITELMLSNGHCCHKSRLSWRGKGCADIQGSCPAPHAYPPARRDLLRKQRPLLRTITRLTHRHLRSTAANAPNEVREAEEVGLQPTSSTSHTTVTTSLTTDGMQPSGRQDFKSVHPRELVQLAEGFMRLKYYPGV